MLQKSHKKILLGGALVALVGLLAAFGVWYAAAGDTTTVLAALAEATITPEPHATPNVVDKQSRKQAKKLAQQQFAAGAFGVIQAADTRTLTIREAGGTTRTFAFISKTQFIVVNKANATANDLRAGDKVLVLGARNKNGTAESIAPRIVLAAPAAYDQDNVLLGRVVSTSANAAQVETVRGARTIAFGEDAQVFGARLMPTTLAELKQDAALLVFGEPQVDETFLARAAIAFPKLRANADMTKVERKEQKRALKEKLKLAKRAQKFKDKQNPDAADKIPGAFGAVTSINANEIQVETKVRGAKTIALDANTKFIVVAKPNATSNDVHAGEQVIVIGGGKKKPARVVIAAPATYTLENLAAGKIQAADARGVTLKTRRGELQLAVSDETQIFDGTIQLIGLDAVQTKTRALAIGLREGANAMNVQVLLVIGKKEK